MGIGRGPSRGAAPCCPRRPTFPCNLPGKLTSLANGPADSRQPNHMPSSLLPRVGRSARRPCGATRQNVGRAVVNPAATNTVAEDLFIEESLADAIAEERRGELELSPILEPSCGANLDATRRGCFFRVWAPSAKEAYVFLYDDGQAFSGERKSVPMEPEGKGFMSAVVPGVQAGQLYHFGFKTHWGAWHERRDAYARATKENTDDCLSCIVVDPAFAWSEFQTPNLENLVLYECHIGSFTGRNDPERAAAAVVGGSFKAAELKLDHIAACGFNALQLMPVVEYSGSWGYNPRLLFPTHEGYGTPHDLRTLVNSAHQKGISVIFDCVLHHGAARSNSLWNYDGWEGNGNGGIYHEGGKQTGFGTAFAFWKEEVKQMLYDACSMYFREYNADGIRIDAAQLLPWDLQQRLTHCLKQEFPGKIVIAESNPCTPSSVHDAGFHSVWDFSSFFEGTRPARSGRARDKLDLNHLKTILGLRSGFSRPSQVVNFILGSHDQIGCRKNGGHHSDTNMAHRYPVDYMGGRSDWTARAITRMWYGIQIVSQGVPMVFMGTEMMQDGFWHVDDHHRVNWDYAGDEIGRQTMEAVYRMNKLRTTISALGDGSMKIVHEDHHNGVLGFERLGGDPFERVLVVINSGSFQADEPNYGVNVDGGIWEEVFNSQDECYGGWATSGNHKRVLDSKQLGEKIVIKLPKYSVLIFLESKQMNQEKHW